MKVKDIDFLFRPHPTCWLRKAEETQGSSREPVTVHPGQ